MFFKVRTNVCGVPCVPTQGGEHTSINTDFLAEERRSHVGWSWHMSMLGSLCDARNIIFNHGEIFKIQVGTVLRQVQTLNIFPLPFPPRNSVEGRFTGSGLFGTVPAAPVRNGMGHVPHVPWRESPICSLCEHNYVYE